LKCFRAKLDLPEPEEPMFETALQARRVKSLLIPDLHWCASSVPPGSGKSSFARKHFKTTEVLSPDYCRGLASDDENNQAATLTRFENFAFPSPKNDWRRETDCSLMQPTFSLSHETVWLAWA